nr:MAG TPA: hypothetical protein [Caudoviricetes sp.]
MVCHDGTYLDVGAEDACFFCFILLTKILWRCSVKSIRHLPGAFSHLSKLN